MTPQKTESPAVEYRDGRWWAHIAFADGVRRWVELGVGPRTAEGRVDAVFMASRWQAAELRPGMVDVSSDLLADEEREP